MQYTTLGRTKLSVSVAGLGCGGHSRLGQTYGNSFEDSLRIVETAIDEGVNFIDTARAYGTEKIVGEAIKNKRDKVIISTKTQIVDGNSFDSPLMSGNKILSQLDENLQRLNTDYIDIYNLHAVIHNQLDHVEAEIVPALKKAQDAGKIRFLGMTELFGQDTDHKMFRDGLKNNIWDVIMVGFNLLNPSARKSVFNQTQEKNIGTQIMFAVRRALSNPKALNETLDVAIKAGQLDPVKLDLQDPLGFVIRESDATSIVEAAYRFCRHEPGADVILTGTGKQEHLRENLAFINKGPLPSETLAKLEAIFGTVGSISGN